VFCHGAVLLSVKLQAASLKPKNNDNLKAHSEWNIYQNQGNAGDPALRCFSLTAWGLWLAAFFTL
jgi:hypothetical protein